MSSVYDSPVKLPEISVKKGKKKTVSLVYEKQFRHLSTDGSGLEISGKI